MTETASFRIIRRITIRLIARGQIAILAALATAAHAKEFRSADVHPLDHPTALAGGYMGKLICKRTSGRRSIKGFGNGALGSEKDTIEQVRIGALARMRIKVAPGTRSGRQ